MQCPSFLAHQRAMAGRKEKNNCESIFGVHKNPTDTHICNFLDPIPPSMLFAVFDKLYEFLREEGVIDELITPVIVRLEVNQLVCLPPEYISVRDGSTIQDCENREVKRWMETVGRKYLAEKYTVVLLGDDLYSRQPVCEHTLAFGYSFIYVCKTSSHKYLYEWIDEFSAEDVHESHTRVWDGKRRLIYRYRNDVSLKEGNVKKHFSFITDIPIKEANIEKMISYGRSRWKIENENNNILKTKGYHLEHNLAMEKNTCRTF